MDIPCVSGVVSMLNSDCAESITDSATAGNMYASNGMKLGCLSQASSR